MDQAQQAARLAALSPPFVSVSGVQNFRDIGGYPIAKSPNHSVRQQIVYRCAAPLTVTDDGILTLQKLGITHVYDLRSNNEIERNKAAGRGDIVEWEGCERVFAPVFEDMDYSPEKLAIRFQAYASDGVSGFAQAYTDILNSATKSYRKILLHLANEPEKPLIVHCTAGKDRTGLICALLLSLCGVEDDVVAHEYSLTEIGLSPEWKSTIMIHLMANPALQANSSRAAAMLATLEVVREKFGGVESYMIEKCGLTKKEVEQIRLNLIVEVPPVHQKTQANKQIQSRSFSSTPHNAQRTTRLRRQMFRWLATSGANFRNPLPGSTNYLNAYNSQGLLKRVVEGSAARKEQNKEDGKETGSKESAEVEKEEIPPETNRDLQPFPLNKFFLSQAVLDEEMREQIWQRVMRKGRSVREVSAELGVTMDRVGAVVRLKEIEKEWIRTGKPLARPYNDAVLSMVPKTSYDPERKNTRPHESINDLPVHAATGQQIFHPTSESRHFTRVDAAKVFDENLLPADDRVPHPELVLMHKDMLNGLSLTERRTRAQEREQEEMKKRQDIAERRAKWAAAVKRVDTSRSEFRITNVNVDLIGKDGRGRKGVGWRYGVPLRDRKCSICYQGPRRQIRLVHGGLTKPYEMPPTPLPFNPQTDAIFMDAQAHSNAWYLRAGTSAFVAQPQNSSDAPIYASSIATMPYPQALSQMTPPGYKQMDVVNYNLQQNYLHHARQPVYLGIPHLGSRSVSEPLLPQVGVGSQRVYTPSNSRCQQYASYNSWVPDYSTAYQQLGLEDYYYSSNSGQSNSSLRKQAYQPGPKPKPLCGAPLQDDLHYEPSTSQYGKWQNGPFNANAHKTKSSYQTPTPRFIKSHTIADDMPYGSLSRCHNRSKRVRSLYQNRAEYGFGKSSLIIKPGPMDPQSIPNLHTTPINQINDSTGVIVKNSEDDEGPDCSGQRYEKSTRERKSTVSFSNSQLDGPVPSSSEIYVTSSEGSNTYTVKGISDAQTENSISSAQRAVDEAFDSRLPPDLMGNEHSGILHNPRNGGMRTDLYYANSGLFNNNNNHGPPQSASTSLMESSPQIKGKPSPQLNLKRWASSGSPLGLTDSPSVDSASSIIAHSERTSRNSSAIGYEGCEGSNAPEESCASLFNKLSIHASDASTTKSLNIALSGLGSFSFKASALASSEEATVVPAADSSGSTHPLTTSTQNTMPVVPSMVIPPAPRECPLPMFLLCQVMSVRIPTGGQKLERATVQKIVTEILPATTGLAFGKDARDLLIECCVEFITLISSEANEISEKESKKTIACEHITKALEQLGFGEYVQDIMEVANEHKEQLKGHGPTASRHNVESSNILMGLFNKLIPYSGDFKLRLRQEHVEDRLINKRVVEDESWEISERLGQEFSPISQRQPHPLRDWSKKRLYGLVRKPVKIPTCSITAKIPTSTGSERMEARAKSENWNAVRGVVGYNVINGPQTLGLR
ncbi:hypothetical protein B7494_g7151 [Chlorociboria aeruginascens]|nr:hypothetical protein B7494_g7151 [Chlorociboria aeruginascens]